MKGIIPLFPRILDWLDWFADCGYTGIVWEYEDRLAWESWPCTHRPGYSREEWRSIWAKCRKLGLEIIPLIQTHGHLEWLLKFDRYAAWRENGCWNEICPRNPEAVKALQNWIGEVRRLHPDSRYIHIGGDETWNLASCGACQQDALNALDAALSSPDDRLPELIGELETVRLADPFDQGAIDWWRLGLRHFQLRQNVVKRSMSYAMLEATHRFVAAEPDYVNHFRQGAQAERHRLDDLFKDVRAYFTERQLSDAEEFVQGRQAALAMPLQQDWADTLIPHFTPKTAR